MIHSTVLYLAGALFAGGAAPPADGKRTATPFELAASSEPCVRAEALVEAIPDGLAPRLASMWPKVSTEVAFRHEDGHGASAGSATLQPVAAARSKAPVLCFVRAGHAALVAMGGQ